MEKYTLYADYLTGKLVFNYPLAVYTALPMHKKIAYQLYLYSAYWMLILVRGTLSAVLLGLWLALSFVPIVAYVADRIFPRVLLMCAGYFRGFKVWQGKTRFSTQLADNCLICGTLTSPYDILVYSLAFKTRRVLLPERFLTSDRQLQKGNYGTVCRISVAFARALFLENLIFKESTESTRQFDLEKHMKKRLLCFPEGTSTNASGVLKSYLPDAVFRNRYVVAAVCKRPWRYIPRVHSRFGWTSIFDSLGAFYTECSVRALVLQNEAERPASSVVSALSGAAGVQACNYNIQDKIKYGLNVDE